MGSKNLATGWNDIIFLCRKCSRKLKGGFGEDGTATLRQALRAELRNTGQRGQVGLLEVKCLGICPKLAVTAGRASQPGQLMIVPVGSQGATALSELVGRQNKDSLGGRFS